MDDESIEWARGALLTHRAALEHYSDSDRWRERRALAESLWPRTRAIVEDVAPEQLTFAFGGRGWQYSAIRAINYTLGLLEHRADIVMHLPPSGPRLSAIGLHPWVWESARPLWGVAHQDAVNAAARSVNAQLRKKLSSTLGEAELTNEAFSKDEPKAGRDRLRFPGKRDDTWTSRLNGARGLGQACFQGIRNVGSHEEADWSEQEALEYLAAFSVLARWIEECYVETFPEPT